MWKSITAASQSGGSPASEQKRMLMMAVANNTKVFVKDPFANYVVQFVLELRDMPVNHIIGQQLLGDILRLSRKKFSSNVIEKCLEYTTSTTKAQMVEEIMHGSESFYSYLMD